MILLLMIIFILLCVLLIIFVNHLTIKYSECDITIFKINIIHDYNILNTISHEA